MVSTVWEVAAQVPDPELPVLTLADLGILRAAEVGGDGTAIVTITPTYTGCPALTEIQADLRRRLGEAGFERVEVRTALSPAWTTDWITDEGRRKLAEHGVAPPGPVRRRGRGPIPLSLGPSRRTAACPHCGSADTEELSEFGSTACKALRRCRACREPFEHIKEI